MLQLLAIAVAVSLAALYGIRYFAADSCLDSGGVFDDLVYACRNDVRSLPNGSLVDPVLAVSALLLAAVLLAISLLLGRARRHPD